MPGLARHRLATGDVERGRDFADTLRIRNRSANAPSAALQACLDMLDFVRISGAPGRTRTSTTLRPPDFESGASTDSATGAWSRQYSRRVKRVNGGAGTAAGPQDGRAIVVLHERVTSGARAADAE